MHLKTIPLAQAEYCANPDLITECIKICPDPGLSSLGVRLGAYIQAIAFFLLVVLAPDEDGAETVWSGMSISYSLVATDFILLLQGAVTSHHTAVVFLLAMLPYIATLGALNSVSIYTRLGSKGTYVLQIGILVKSLLTALLWALVLVSFWGGQLPSSLHIGFRQPACFKDTALVLFVWPVRPSDPNRDKSTALLVVYTCFWAIVLIAGSYWTIKAPRYIRNVEAAKAAEALPAGVVLPASGSSEDEDEHADLIGIRKDPNFKTARYRTERSIKKGEKGTKEPREEGKVERIEEKARLIATHHTNWIWPCVGFILLMNIIATELQIALNPIFEGELELDFPGTLALLLAMPTAWAVFKAWRRIHRGKRLMPADRVDQTIPIPTLSRWRKRRKSKNRSRTKA